MRDLYSDPLLLLIVEDHSEFGEMLSALLELDERVNVAAVAADLRTAVAVALEQPIDIAIVDVELGKHEDGVAVVDALREFRPNVAALMMTGFEPDWVEERALAAGASAVLRKPDVVRRGVDALVEAFSAHESRRRR